MERVCARPPKKEMSMIRQNKMTNFAMLLLATLLFAVFVSDDAEAASYTVDKFGGADYTNITQAVENASATDTLRVAARPYHDAVEVDKRLTIIGGNYGLDLGDLYDCNDSPEDGNLIAYYDFDENGGSSADDGAWCHDLDGDIDGASWASGVFGSGLDFDGSNDYVEIEDDDDIDFTSAVSVSAWFNFDSFDEGANFIVSKQQSTSSGQFKLQVTDNGDGDVYPTFTYISSDGQKACDALDSSISTDTWVHVAAVKSSASIKIYVNGLLSETCSHTEDILVSTLDLLVGASHSSDGVTGYVDGTIDDLGLWNDALTAGEVENIYWAGQNEKPTVNASNGGYAFKVTAANSWLKFFNVEYSGPDVGDSSGDGGVIVDDADSVKISEFYFK